VCGGGLWVGVCLLVCGVCVCGGVVCVCVYVGGWVVRWVSGCVGVFITSHPGHIFETVNVQ